MEFKIPTVSTTSNDEKNNSESDKVDSNHNKLKQIPTATFPSANSSQRISTGSSSSSTTSTTRRNKITLAPGHSPLDWARLKQTTPHSKLLGPTITALKKYTLSEISQHNTRQDAWTTIRGKVFNMTAYLPFHPGGEQMLLSVAGKDGTLLFEKYHHWVNADFLLDKCLVGFLIFD